MIDSLDARTIAEMFIRHRLDREDRNGTAPRLAENWREEFEELLRDLERQGFKIVREP